MADNINVTPGTGKTVAADEVGGVLYQRVKLAAGVDGAATDVSAAAPLPVEDANSDALLAAAQAIETAVEGTLTVAGAVTTGGLTDTQLRASAVPVSGTVTASGPLTDVQLRASPVAVLDTNSAALLAAAQAIQTAAQILDNIVAGSEAQVDVVAALPAGANTIGNVVILDGSGNDPEYAKEGDNWNAADHGMILFARDVDSNPDKYRAVQVDPNGYLKVTPGAGTLPVSLASLPALPAGTNNIGDVDIASIAAGDNNIGNVDVASALPAGENLIGLVGTSDIVVTVTPTCHAGALASGDLFFDSTEVANAVRANGYSCVLQSLTIIDKDDQGAAFTVYIADAATDFGTLDSAPDADDTEAATVIGWVPVATADYVDLGAAKVACIRNIGLTLKAGASTTSIYIAGVNGTGTPTYSASGLVFKLGILRS